MRNLLGKCASNLIDAELAYFTICLSNNNVSVTNIFSLIISKLKI